MSMLFEPIAIGQLQLRNRLMRSATAERMVTPADGAPQPRLAELYGRLAGGGIGLIVTGHAYVHLSGRAHNEMASMADDALIPAWRQVIRPAQDAGARVMVQLNHAGASVDPAFTPQALSPSGVATNDRATPTVMTDDDIALIVAAFGRAARRAREAGFDGVQIHAAHGYLVNQFLMPATNLRTDAWGGDVARRHSFLGALARTVRHQVGRDYPVWIKLGVSGRDKWGLTPATGALAAAACPGYGIDRVEISHALGVPESLDHPGEGQLLPLAQTVRAAVGPSYPLALVYGFRTPAVMEELLASGLVQIISLSRPLIAQPDLPLLLQKGEPAQCVRCGKCWPESPGEGIACHNTLVQKALRAV